MAMWTSDELSTIGNTEEVEIAGRRRDGTLRTPVTIWIARLGDDLYVRSVNGRDSAWFRGTQVRHEGRVQAGRVGKDVAFVESDPGINDKLNAEYRAKYRRYAGKILNSILTPKAQATTLRVEPKS
ncbi:MAG TPA: DUF2255 family protein [bacterium]|nr:DUF2255 family protein [bacterium]